MARTKSPDPRDRLGVFKRYDDVPPKHRLEQYASTYEDRDVWAEFCTEHEYDQNSTKSYRTEVDLAGSDWTTFMTDRSSHHALATPEDVEAWCQELLSTKSTRRSYDYWLRIRRFYDWLLWHPDHPHVYHPLLMAVVEGNAAMRIWEEKIGRWKQVRKNQTEEAE